MAQEWRELTRLTGGRPVVIERVRMTETGVSIEGEFELPQLVGLSAEDQVFLAAFVRSHGSIKKMEQFFGVSYPTIKNRLNKIAEQLEFVEIDSEAVHDDPLGRLERGEIGVEQALKDLREERGS
jgi:hypothetical protein